MSMKKSFCCDCHINVNCLHIESVYSQSEQLPRVFHQ